MWPMSFARSMTRCPRPFDPDRGADAVQAVPELAGDLAKLVRGAAGCSPYLADLLRAEAGWLVPAFADPMGAVEAELLALPDVPLEELPLVLRQAKRRVALITALADLAGVWPLEQVTQVLTDLADAAVQSCVAALVSAEVARGKLPAGGDPQACGGMVVLAMGKMGGGELNFSSDIDLICLFDETRFDPDDYHDVRASFIRVTRKICLLYTSPSPRDQRGSRMPSSA